MHGNLNFQFPAHRDNEFYFFSAEIRQTVLFAWITVTWHESRSYLTSVTSFPSRSARASDLTLFHAFCSDENFSGCSTVRDSWFAVNILLIIQVSVLSNPSPSTCSQARYSASPESSASRFSTSSHTAMYCSP